MGIVIISVVSLIASEKEFKEFEEEISYISSFREISRINMEFFPCEVKLLHEKALTVLEDTRKFSLELQSAQNMSLQERIGLPLPETVKKIIVKRITDHFYGNTYFVKKLFSSDSLPITTVLDLYSALSQDRVRYVNYLIADGLTLERGWLVAKILQGLNLKVFLEIYRYSAKVVSSSLDGPPKKRRKFFVLPPQ